VAAISEIVPLSTEAAMTSVSVGVDDNSKRQAGKTTTTVRSTSVASRSAAT
jgi:hypothetical protein